MFFKIGVLKKLATLTGKHLYWSLFIINFAKKRIYPRFFSCEYCKIFKKSFFFLTLPVAASTDALQKDVPKNFANFSRACRYRSPFLSSCRSRTCNFVKIGDRYSCFTVNFVKFLIAILCRTTLTAAPGCSKVLREINIPEIKNSSKKLEQRHYEISDLEKVLLSYKLHLTNYLN